MSKRNFWSWLLVAVAAFGLFAPAAWSQSDGDHHTPGTEALTCLGLPTTPPPPG